MTAIARIFYRTTSHRSVVSALKGAMETRKQRRQLASMSAHQLADIGLERTDVIQELNRSVWDAPAHWKA